MDYIEMKPSTNGYTNFQIDKTLHADMIFTPTASSVYTYDPNYWYQYHHCYQLHLLNSHHSD